MKTEEVGETGWPGERWVDEALGGARIGGGSPVSLFIFGVVAQKKLENHYIK